MYEKVIRYEKYPSNKKIAHFPSTIPDDVDNKEFKEWGTVGSDDAGMILSYSVSNNEINTEEFKEKIQSAKYKASSKIGLEEVSQKLYIPQIVYDTLGLNDEGNINNDFSTYILDASDQESTNSKSDYSTIFSDDTYFLQNITEYFAQNFAYFFTPMSLNPMEMDGPKNKAYFNTLNTNEWS